MAARTEHLSESTREARARVDGRREGDHQERYETQGLDH